MMRTLLGLLAAGVLTAAPAHAAIYSSAFSGAVTQQTGAGLTVGTTVTGSFAYSSDASRFLNFTINGISAAQPLVSTVTISPTGISNPYEVIYTASTSIPQGSGTTNSAFTLDLLAYTNFASSNALTILNTPNLGSQLETQANSFDGNFSDFTYYTGSATAVTKSFTVALNPNSLVTQVPEPATLALLAAPMLGMILRRRR